MATTGWWRISASPSSALRDGGGFRLRLHPPYGSSPERLREKSVRGCIEGLHFVSDVLEGDRRRHGATAKNQRTRMLVFAFKIAWKSVR